MSYSWNYENGFHKIFTLFVPTRSKVDDSSRILPFFLHFDHLFYAIYVLITWRMAWRDIQASPSHEIKFCSLLGTKEEILHLPHHFHS